LISRTLAAGGRRAGSRVRVGVGAAHALDLVERETLAVAGRDSDLALYVVARFYVGHEVRLRGWVAGSDDVSANERQTGKDELTFLVRLRVVPGGHVHAKHIDLRVGEWNLLTVGLLHPNVAAQFAHLRESRHRSNSDDDRNCDRCNKASTNHLFRLLQAISALNLIS